MAWSSIFTTLSNNLSKVELFSARESDFSMKKFPGFVEFASNLFRQKWINEGAVFLALLTVAVGCGKKSDQAVSTTPQTNAEAPSQPAAPVNQAANQPNPVNQANQPNQAATQVTAAPAAPAAPDLSAVNRAVRSWILANRRPPRNFEDFAATAGVTIPPAPPGKKYVLGSDMHVQLVNQ
jgi:hypothetical protein